MNSKQATQPIEQNRECSLRNSLSPPGDPLISDYRPVIPLTVEIESCIFAITSANHEAQVSARRILLAKTSLKTLSISCRWSHAKLLRVRAASDAPAQVTQSSPMHDE